PTTGALITLATPPPPRSTLFPYTTLFRSHDESPGTRSPRHSRAAAVSARGVGALARAHARERDAVARERRFERRRAQSLSRTARSEEHTSELQSRENLVCRLLLEKKKKHK